VVRSKAMAIKAKGLYDGFKSFIGYVDDVDFLNLASLPRPSAPPLFEAGPDWNFVPLSTKPLGDWLVDLKMPECPCDGAPPPPPPFMENNTQAARNYTAFAPAKEKQEKKSASAVPIPSVSLRSFVSLPVLIDLFGWLPDFGWLAGLLVIVDILLIVFTHIRTIQGVAALVRGHIEEDEIVRDYNVGARVVRACGCGWGAALIACVLRCVDVCEVAMRKHRRILVTAVSGHVQRAARHDGGGAVCAGHVHFGRGGVGGADDPGARRPRHHQRHCGASDVGARHRQRQGDRECARDQHADAARRRERVQSGAL
jgi:hypothetical protein